MTIRIQSTILLQVLTTLFSLSISNVSIPVMAVNPGTLQGIEDHLTEVQQALDTNDVEGAKMHLNLAMEQLNELQNKAATMKSP